MNEENQNLFKNNFAYFFNEGISEFLEFTRKKIHGEIKENSFTYLKISILILIVSNLKSIFQIDSKYLNYEKYEKFIQNNTNFENLSAIHDEIKYFIDNQ